MSFAPAIVLVTCGSIHSIALAIVVTHERTQDECIAFDRAQIYTQWKAISSQDDVEKQLNPSNDSFNRWNHYEYKPIFLERQWNRNILHRLSTKIHVIALVIGINWLCPTMPQDCCSYSHTCVRTIMVCAFGIRSVWRRVSHQTNKSKNIKT